MPYDLVIFETEEEAKEIMMDYKAEVQMFNPDEIKYESLFGLNNIQNTRFSNVEGIDLRFHPWIGLRRNRARCEAAPNPNPTWQPNIGDGCVVMKCQACTGTTEPAVNTDKGTQANCPICPAFGCSNTVFPAALTACDKDYDSFRTGFRGTFSMETTGEYALPANAIENGRRNMCSNTYDNAGTTINNGGCIGRNTGNSCPVETESGTTEYAMGMVSGCQSAGSDDGNNAINSAFHYPGCSSGWPPNGYYYTNMRSKEFFEWVDGRKLSETDHVNWRWCNNDSDGEVVSLYQIIYDILSFTEKSHITNNISFNKTV